MRSSDPAVADRVRRGLSRRVSVAGMLEVLMWSAVPYLIAGIGWSFVNADDVGRLESELRTVVPAGADVGAFGITTALWPALLIAPDLCET